MYTQRQNKTNLTTFLQLFQKEIDLWLSLQHENIQHLEGFAYGQEDGYPMLVSPWMSNGNALSYVKKNQLSPSEVSRLVCNSVSNSP